MTTLRTHCIQLYDRHKTTLLVMAGMFILHSFWQMNRLVFFPKPSPVWLWLQMFLFILTLFGCRHWKLATVTWLWLCLLLVYANKIKCDLLLFPVTEMDLKIVTDNPVGFLDAVGIGRSCQYAALAALFLAGGYLAARYARPLLRPRHGAGLVIELALLALLVAGSFKLYSHFYLDYGAYIFENRTTFLDKNFLWAPEGMVKASQQLTAIGFLSYSHSANTLQRYNFVQNATPEHRSVTRQTVTGVAGKYFTPPAATSRQLPNIVFILAESTFNPNAAFRLTKTVTNSLFTPTDEEVGGLMHVTAIGGGTWKTEFETITGVDSRMFGFAGEYTHASLSPFVKESFPTYLERKGYETRTFYPVKGNFYSARSAYENYGFMRFDDAKDLKLEETWTKFSDEKMAETVAPLFSARPDKPFFYYLLTLEGHSPYYCKHFTPEIPFPVQFTNDTDFGRNCKLNEYILKIASTERALARIVTRLRSIEETTGRPFILVIFGDHQPIELVHDQFNKYRTKLTMNHTFYKIIKSESINLPELKNEFNATMIPSLVSTAVADTADQIYLPENFYLYEKCGAIPELTSCPDSVILTETYRDFIKGEWFK